MEPVSVIRKFQGVIKGGRTDRERESDENKLRFQLVKMSKKVQNIIGRKVELYGW